MDVRKQVCTFLFGQKQPFVTIQTIFWMFYWKIKKLVQFTKLSFVLNWFELGQVTLLFACSKKKSNSFVQMKNAHLLT